MAIESYLSPDEAAVIRGEFQNLGATIAELNDHPTVTFTRRGGTTIGPVECIKIRLDGQQGDAVGGGTAFTGTDITGTLKAFTEAFPQPVNPGDTFTWNDQTCRVTTGPVEKFGIQSVRFALMVGNGGA